MKHPTHICIETATPTAKCTPIIKKGDFVIFNREDLIKKDYWIFEEDLLQAYHNNLFLPLPPPKTIYVAVEQGITVPNEELILS